MTFETNDKYSIQFKMKKRYSHSASCYLLQVIGGLVDLEQMQDDYEHLVTNLLEWIHTKVGELNDRNFTNSLVGIKRDMTKFTDYRLQEKPPK